MRNVNAGQTSESALQLVWEVAFFNWLLDRRSLDNYFWMNSQMVLLGAFSVGCAYCCSSFVVLVACVAGVFVIGSCEYKEASLTYWMCCDCLQNRVVSRLILSVNSFIRIDTHAFYCKYIFRCDMWVNPELHIILCTHAYQLHVPVHVYLGITNAFVCKPRYREWYRPPP